ncbi:MAG: hypothetical protein ACYTX0_39640 [Nostoc sp.]
MSFAIAFDYPPKLINNYTCGIVLLIREQRDRSCEGCDAYGGLFGVAFFL